LGDTKIVPRPLDQIVETALSHIRSAMTAFGPGPALHGGRQTRRHFPHRRAAQDHQRL
jgi:hypothetical protein